jgi:TolB-like protein
MRNTYYAKILMNAITAALLLSPIMIVAEDSFGVIPFSCRGISEDESMIIARGIRAALGQEAEKFESSEVMDALEEVACDDSRQWSLDACIIGAGEELGADYMIGGTIVRLGTNCEVGVSLFSVKKRVKLWTTVYSFTGDAETIYTTVPQKLCSDIHDYLRGAADNNISPALADSGISFAAAQDSQVNDTPHTAVAATAAKQDSQTVSQQLTVTSVPVTRQVYSPVPQDNGIVSGFTMGFTGMLTLGEAGREQSSGGFCLSFIYPTTGHSQARLKTGVPMFRNANLDNFIDTRLPDPYISLEHDWSWRRFGLTGGISYMYLNSFTKSNYWHYFLDNGYSDFSDMYSNYYYKKKTTQYYETVHAFNATLGFRAGTATKGFIGRLSWPFAFTLSQNEPKNYFFECSVSGFLGWGLNTFSIGMMGMVKHREPDPGRSIEGSVVQVSEYEFSRNYYRQELGTYEFYNLIPVVRYLRLIGDHLILGLNLELGGIILPRSMLPDFFSGDNDYYDDSESHKNNWWQPSAGCMITYSFGKLMGAHLFDGTF